MWVVAISTEGDPNLTLVQFDYWLEASHAATRLSENTPCTMRDANAALQGDVLKYSPDSDKQTLVMDPLEQSVDLAISHQDNTLIIVSHVPGIKPKSTIMFFTHDYLLGHDFIECGPGLGWNISCVHRTTADPLRLLRASPRQPDTCRQPNTPAISLPSNWPSTGLVTCAIIHLSL